MTRRDRAVAGFVTLLVAAASAGPVAAQPSAADARCIAAINKGVRRMALAQNKAIRSCAKNWLRGGIATVETCVGSQAPLVVTATASRVAAQIDAACAGVPPSFGPADLAAPDLALDAGLRVLADLFGSTATSMSPTAPDVTKTCQTTVLAGVQKCANARLKEFEKCKARGLRTGAITTSEGIAACFFDGAGQPDPSGKLDQLCLEKPAVSIRSRCAGRGVDLDGAVPGCEGVATSTELTECIDHRIRCRTCNLVNDADGTNVDCDVFDDGDDGNDSCAEGAVCGDGIVDGHVCDDGNATSGDGCHGASCVVEPGWTCTGQPSACTPICGDGLVVGDEGCDDGGTSGGDGCDASCTTETGWHCVGQPSACGPVCGDGLIRGDEECDDLNPIGSDGCSFLCQVEPGFVCTGEPSDCGAFGVTITSPAHGSFTLGTAAIVTGFVSNLPPAQAALTINGNPVVVAGGGSFSTIVPISAAAIYNPIRATVTDVSNGAKAHARVVAIAGPSVANGAFSPQSVALRLNDSGLDAVEPLVAELAGGGLNLADLVPVGTVLVNNQCFIDSIFGCLGRATVSIANPPPAFSSFGLAMDSMTGFVAGDITVNDIRVDVQLSGSGLVPSCPITIRAARAFFNGDYSLEPDAGDASNIDVNQLGPLDVSFTSFTTSYGGICDVPVIGDIIQAFMPNVQSLTVGAMRDFLDDPDGSGPADSPTAGAIEAALAGISITGPIGEGLGAQLDAPLFAIPEDPAGLTLGSNSRFTISIGTGPGQCIPPPGAPALARSLSPPAPFPAFGANTPAGGIPYGLGIAVSPAGFNQLLRAQVECGLLVTTITEFDLGFGPVPLTAGLLSILVPELSSFPPSTPFRLDVRPTLAPVVTGNAGPGGALTELRIAHVVADMVADDGSETIVLTAAFDTNVGMDLAFAPGGLGVTLVPGATPTVAILYNPLLVNETNLETNVLPPLVASLLPQLAGSLAGFPLPDFLGLQLSGVEVSRNGNFLSLFANLTPTP
jgi:cysteine-rich repeat protein